MSSIKQPIITIIIALAIIVGAILLWGKGEKKEEVKKQETAKTVVSPQITQIKNGEMPKGFPKEIPLNGKVKITQSYNAEYPTQKNIKQSVIAFESKEPMEKNYEFYLNWIKKNGWEVINKSEKKPMMIYGRKKGNETAAGTNSGENTAGIINVAVAATIDINITIIPKVENEKMSEVNIGYVEF